MSRMPALAAMPPGFADAGLASQAVFRSALQALARPGRSQPVDAPDLDEAASALELSPALAALMLTLLDAEVTLWLSPALDTPVLRTWLGFHTGVRRVAQPEEAGFLALRAEELDLALWLRAQPGTDERPQDGATLLVDVIALDEGARLTLSGPGIQTRQPLAVRGIAAEVWAARMAATAAYPLGVELFLCHDRRFIGLPRSARLQVEA
jgi:alpha-D-ribose 1-methylphosphonate 5-triphosphate synthase subunit PhnH